MQTPITTQLEAGTMQDNSITRAYEEGYRIGKRDPNGSNFQCKYPKGSDEYEEFNDGYLDGQADYWEQCDDAFGGYAFGDEYEN